ncbi:MAG: hypothetical protein AAF570_09950, partial [Bacteroidota bacterium]
NENKMSATNYRAGKKHGIEELWNRRGHLIKVLEYENDSLISQEYKRPKRVIARQGFYRVVPFDGELYQEDGIWIFRDYRFSGKAVTKDSGNDNVTHISHYMHGERHGAFEQYHHETNRTERGSYRFGKKHGIWRTYDPAGEVTKEEEYENGRKIR